jgi:hypothetical protein
MELTECGIGDWGSYPNRSRMFLFVIRSRPVSNSQHQERDPDNLSTAETKNVCGFIHTSLVLLHGMVLKNNKNIVTDLINALPGNSSVNSPTHTRRQK